MKHKIIITHKNNEITLSVTQEDYKETLENIYFTLSRRVENLSEKSRKNFDIKLPFFTCSDNLAEDLIKIAEAILNEANRDTNHEAKRNALEFFENVKQIYKTLTGKDYDVSSNSLTGVEKSGQQNPAVSARTTSRSTTTLISSKHTELVSKEDNETSAAKSSNPIDKFDVETSTHSFFSATESTSVAEAPPEDYSLSPAALLGSASEMESKNKPTMIGITNNSVEQKIKEFRAPYLKSKPKDPLEAHASDNLESNSDPITGDDYGGITYSNGPRSNCYLFWKKSRDTKNGIYTFELSAQSSNPKITCEAKTLFADPKSGDYSVKFSIKKSD